MKYLILETSHKKSALILAQDQEPIETIILSKENSASKSLHVQLSMLLKRHSLELKHLAFIAVSKGPGSFTGVRIGAAIAKTLCFSKNIPLVSFCSLCAYPPKMQGDFLSVLDAKSGGVYLVEGTKTTLEITYQNPKILPMQQACVFFEKAPTIISPDVKELLIKEPKFQEKYVYQDLDPMHLAKFTYNLFCKQNYSKNHELDLLYLSGPNLA